MADSGTRRATAGAVPTSPRPDARRRPDAERVGSALVVVGLAVLTGWLSFSEGGFLAGETALATLAVLGALLLWVMLATQPIAGLGPAGLVGIVGFGVLAAWTLGSASWSGAPARAQIEFTRVLLYLSAFALMACLPHGRANAAWLLRLLALALAAAVVAGLVSRLYPGISEASDLRADERLGWPLGYWNALGLAGTLALLGGLHLTSDLREARVTRVLAAAAVPAVAVGVYLTLSRGAIAAGLVGLAVLLVLGWSRGMLTGLLAVVPFTAYALIGAYDAPALTDAVAADAASERQGAELASLIALSCAGAALARALGLAVDSRLLARLRWRPWPVRRKAALFGGLAAVVVVAGLTAGAGGMVERQWQDFTEAPALEAEDRRSRLAQASANGRIEHWVVALDAWESEPVLGTGAGTYANTWAAGRETEFSVQDGHSLYFEVLSELGVVGLAALAVALGAPLVALLRRRSEDRLLWSAVLAVAVTWLVRAGADWDWEMPALTLPVIALLGAACARREPRPAGRYAQSRTLRVVAGLALLLLLITPWQVYASQRSLERALAAFQQGDCVTSIDASLAAVETLDSRPAAFELLGYCDVRTGRPELAVRMLRAAVRRDPESWELRYGLGLVQAAAGLDPRPSLRRADRLNPLDPRIDAALEALDSDRPRVWRREAYRLPLVVPGAQPQDVDQAEGGAS